MTETKKLGPTRELGCCCCGNSTRGRQWWNRDTGYGICPECVTFVRAHGESEAEILENYGQEGIHWNVEAVAPASCPDLHKLTEAENA